MKTSHYRDFASVQEQDIPKRPVAKETNKETNFPVRLHYVLKEMEKDGLQDIISWQPHGRAFMVRNPERFEKEYLPLWFRQSKIASFQRQLNIYGFTRITSGPDKGSYYHELFLRGKGFLTHRMLRRKTGAAGKRDHVDKSPNLYRFVAMPTEVSSNQGRVTGTVQLSPPSMSASYAAGSVGPFLGVRSTPLLHASLHDGAQRITSTPHVLPRHQALLRPNIFGTACAKSHASVPPSFGVYMEGQQHYRRAHGTTSLVSLVGGQSGFLVQNAYGSMPRREGFN